MDRRTFTAALGLGLIIGPTFAARAAELHTKAQAEGNLTWYVAHYGTTVSEMVAKRFMEMYPGVQVNVVRATSQAIFQRLSQDIRSKASNCDVFSSSDASHYLALKKQGALLPYTSKNLKGCLPSVQQASDPEHFFTVTDVFMTSMVRGTKNVTEDEAPKKWTDLLDRRWHKQISLAHPGFSGDAGAWMVAMNRLYGWEFFEALAKNEPLVGRSIADVPTTLGSGERKIGVAPPNYVLALQSRGLPVAPILPEDGVGVGYASSAIIATTKRPHASQLFLEFLGSKEVGETLATEFRIPIRPDVIPQPGIPTIGSTKGNLYDPVEMEAELPRLIEKWRDTFGV